MLLTLMQEMPRDVCGNLCVKAKAPPKAKIYCWKNYSQQFLIKTNLAKKGVQTNLMCMCFAGITWKQQYILCENLQ